MNINYEWKIVNVIKNQELKGLKNVIIRVVFEYRGTDTDTGVSEVYMGGINLQPPTSENFTDISEVTKEQVISWLESTAIFPRIKKQVELWIKKSIEKSGEVKAEEITWID